MRLRHSACVSLTEFTAHAVGVVEPGEFEADVLVLAEGADGSGKWLEVQGPTAEGFTEQDRRLGLDTYCLVNENQATVYGGVESWSCDDARVCISLNTKAGQLLGAADGYVIRIPDPEDLALAKAALQRILGS